MIVPVRQDKHPDLVSSGILETVKRMLGVSKLGKCFSQLTAVSVTSRMFMASAIDTSKKCGEDSWEDKAAANFLLRRSQLSAGRKYSSWS